MGSLKVKREVRIEMSDEEGREVRLWESDGWTHITCLVGGEWVVRAHGRDREFVLRGAVMMLELLREKIG